MQTPKFVATLAPNTTAQPPFKEIECADLGELMNVYASEELVGDKRGMPLVFAAQFAPDAHTKSAASILKMNRFIAMDYDDGSADDVARASDALAAHCGYGIYTTHSYTDAEPCVRFVIVLNREVSKEEYRACWFAINKLIGGKADRATKDITRGCYVWGRPAGREPGATDIVEGPELDVDWLLSQGSALDEKAWAAATIPLTPSERKAPLPLVEGQRVLMLSDFEVLRDKLKGGTEHQKLARKFLEAACKGESWGKAGEREPAMNAAAYAIASAFLTERPETSMDIDGSIAAFSQAFYAAEGQGSKQTLANFARKIREKLHVVAERKANPSSETFFPLTELGMAERLARATGGKLYFVPAWNKWIAWDSVNGVWATMSGEAHAFEAAARVARALQAEGKQLGEDGEALVSYGRSCETYSRTKAIVGYAARNTKAHISPDAFDRKPMLLNVKNGVVDLSTGKLLPHAPEHHLTRIAAVSYEPDATCPRWVQFIDEVTGGDIDTAAYLQRFCGYLLTGETREHELLFCVGTGRNGKGVMFNTLFAMLGEYATKCPLDLLIAKKHENHPQELADLFGRRLALISETEPGQRWASAKLKTLTGGDPISARRMNENMWVFQPTHKFVIAGNTEPAAEGDDKALWARIRRVPFNVSFLGREDRGLPEALKAELPGILNWCIAGCLEWLKLGGTKPSRTVNEATEEYRQDNDVVQDFLDECCVVRKGATCKRNEAFRAFEQWQARSNEPVRLSGKMFTEKLKRHGIKASALKTHGERLYEGFELKVSVTTPKFGQN